MVPQYSRGEKVAITTNTCKSREPILSLGAWSPSSSRRRKSLLSMYAAMVVISSTIIRLLLTQVFQGILHVQSTSDE